MYTVGRWGAAAGGRDSRLRILRPHPLGIALVGLLDTLDVASGWGGVLVLFWHDGENGNHDVFMVTSAPAAANGETPMLLVRVSYFGTGDFDKEIAFAPS